MSDPTTADLLGLPLGKLPFEGKDYEVRELTIVERGQYQRWLEDELRAAVGRDTDSPDPEADRHRVNKSIAAGECEFDGELATARRRSWTGQVKLWEIMFGFDPETAERFQKLNAERFAELLKKAVLDEDPKAQGALIGPLLRSLGLPRDFLSAAFSTSSGRKPPKRSGGSPSRNSGRSTVRQAGKGKRANSKSRKAVAVASASP